MKLSLNNSIIKIGFRIKQPYPFYESLTERKIELFFAYKEFFDTTS